MPASARMHSRGLCPARAPSGSSTAPTVAETARDAVAHQAELVRPASDFEHHRMTVAVFISLLCAVRPAVRTHRDLSRALRLLRPGTRQAARSLQRRGIPERGVD